MTSYGLIIRLALRAIRWRAAASATVFAVAVIAILAATMGPIYLHAVDEAVLTAHLKRASHFQRDVVISRGTLLGYPHVDWGAPVQKLATDFGHAHLFVPPVTEQQVEVTYGSPPEFKSQIANVAGQCTHVHIVRGRCVSANSTDETLISTSTAKIEHLSLGDTLAAVSPNGIELRLRVVGEYRPVAPRGSFWEAWSLFDYGQPPPPRGYPPADASFVSEAALTSRLQRMPQSVSTHLTLLPERVRSDDIGGLRRSLAQVHASVADLVDRQGETGLPAPTVSTILPTILDSTTAETSLARTLVTVATAQLALLAIFLLYVVVANTTAVQGPEVALAKLRGRRTSNVLLQSVVQPVLLVVAAAPVGALLAWVVVRLLAARLLGQPVQVTFPLAAYGIAALGVLGGILAAAVAAHRIVVTPVGALMRRGTIAPGSRVGLLLADAAAVTLAVAGLIELDAGGVLNAGKPNPLAVLAPTLLAIAAAVVALRLLPYLARGLARWTRDSSRLATFLAVRHLLRRPAEARALLPVAVALSIAAFAVINWADARHNRSLRALNTAGAQTVLFVRPGAGVDDLRTAVDHADPSGQSMAVAYTKRDGGLPPLIAVDVARFQSVGAWVPGNAPVSLRSVLHTLAGGRPAPVTIVGSHLRLRVGLTRHPHVPVRLTVHLTMPDHKQIARTIVPVVPGTTSYDISLPSVCVQRCAITSLRLTANTPVTEDGGARTSEIDARIDASARSHGAWQPVEAFGDSTRWRGNGRGPAEIHSAGAALSLHVRQTPASTTWPTIISAAIPITVPAVVASALAGRYEGDQIHDVFTVGLDGQGVDTDGVIRSVTLPRVDRDAVMVDFGTALEVMRNASSHATRYEVWLSPSAPTNMAARLARQHVSVTRTIRSASYRPAVDDTGPAFADSLFLVAALAATLLAIGATAIGRVVSVRRRGYELAALEAVGISPRTLRRALTAEVASIFGVGLIVGLAAGVVGSHLALPSTPVFVDVAIGPPLVFGLPWTLLAVLTAGLVIVLGVVSVAIARLVERAAGPGQLRGAQQ